MAVITASTKPKEVDIREDHVSQLMRGERPEGMDFEEFKIKRKATQKLIEQIKKGRVFHDSGKGPYTKV